MTGATPRQPPAADPASGLRVLVVDDHPRLREPLARFLRGHGLRVRTAPDLGQMRHCLRQQAFDVVVLDVMLPDGDGAASCAGLRAQGMPVILLTAQDHPDARVRGLERGAEDYVVKPFDPRELLARIRNVARRGRPMVADSAPATPSGYRYRFDGWCFEQPQARLTSPIGEVCALGDAQARLLDVLLAHANTVLSRDQLLELTQTQGRLGDLAFDRTVDRQVSRLRQRLQSDGARDPVSLRTVRGGGYMLVARVQRERG